VGLFTDGFSRIKVTVAEKLYWPNIMAIQAVRMCLNGLEKSPAYQDIKW
jgi:hypothetical protein